MNLKVGQWHAKMDPWCRPKSLYTMLKTDIRNQIFHKATTISAIDLISVKKCRPWSDDVSETRRLVLVYTFCKCPKVPFRVTLAKWFFWWSSLLDMANLCLHVRDRYMYYGTRKFLSTSFVPRFVQHFKQKVVTNLLLITKQVSYANNSCSDEGIFRIKAVWHLATISQNSEGVSLSGHRQNILRYAV